MPTITVPDATYQRLATVARRSNRSIEELLDPALDEIISAGAEPGVERMLNHDEWLSRLEEWQVLVRNRAATGPTILRVDDSREAIYEGCGE